MPYFDTSVIVSYLIADAHSEAAEAELAALDAEDRIISEWTLAELASALGTMVRTERIDALTGSDALRRFERTVETAFIVLPVASPDFRDARALLGDFGSGLRVGDALHLAVARRSRRTLASFDTTQVAAAQAAGVSAELIGSRRPSRGP